MGKLLFWTSLVLLVVGLFAYAQDRPLMPRNGFVPDAKTAVRVAEAVLSAIYGEEHIKSERPFSAKLTGDTWVVRGSLPQGADGGVAEIKISRTTCKIVSISHGK